MTGMTGEPMHAYHIKRKKNGAIMTACAFVSNQVKFPIMDHLVSGIVMSTLAGARYFCTKDGLLHHI